MRDPISIKFTPTNDSMDNYEITIDVPKVYQTEEAMPPFMCDVAAIHMYLTDDKNMDTIVKYFEDNVDNYEVEEEQ